MCEQGQYVEIWTFVENKMKVSVPNYIKNVLNYCGYDSVQSLSTVEVTDIQYMAEQVRKGGITDYFANEFGKENALQGSSHSEENFDFCRGHLKLLLAIVKLVKQTLTEEGIKGFASRETKHIKKLDTPLKTTINPKKVMKDKSVATEDSFLFNSMDCKEFLERLVDHQATLLKLTIRNLYCHTPVQYEKNLASIGSKVCSELVHIHYDNQQKEYSGIITCPYCAECIEIPPFSNEWIILNFVSHLTTIHNEESDTEKEPNACNTSLFSNELPIANNFDSKCSEKATAENGSHKSDAKDAEGDTTDKLNAEKVVKEGDYVICSTESQTYYKWPENTPIFRYFLGQIIRIDAKNGFAVKKEFLKVPKQKCYFDLTNIFQAEKSNNATHVFNLDEIELRMLEKKPNSKCIFSFEKNDARKVVSVRDIVKVLQDPSQDRRRKLVFKDKSLLEYNL